MHAILFWNVHCKIEEGTLQVVLQDIATITILFLVTQPRKP